MIKGLEGITKREFLKGLVLAPTSLLIATAKEQFVDLDHVLKNELSVRRKEPPLLISPFDGRISRYDQHLTRFGSASAGALDFDQVEKPTMIVPAVSGYVRRVMDNVPGFGMGILLLHPFGYVTLYIHLNARYAVPRLKLERTDIMAEMGKSGDRAQGITHLHFELGAPSYVKYLKGVKANLSIRGYYALDPEEFSIAGKDSALPYQELSDGAFDDALWKKHFEAQEFLSKVVREYPRGQFVAREAPPGRRTIADEHGVRDLDDEITFVYESILKDNHPFSQNYAREIFKTLRSYMLLVPRLTAPIKEPGRELYRPLPYKRVAYR